MERTCHYLRPSKHVGFPDRQAVVSIAWERIPRNNGTNIADDILTCWTALEWQGEPGHEKWTAEGAGFDADSWWRWLDTRRRKRKTLWVWAIGMAHTLTIMGFWEMITNGQFCLSKRDTEKNGGHQRGSSSSFDGCCIVEDPPTIVYVQRPHSSGGIRFVDARNLGLDCDRGNQGIGSDCRHLAGFIRQWCRTVDELKLGGLRTTAASQSWHGWRHNYLECGVLVHDCAEATRLERDSLHPGRAEAFRIGLVRGTISQCDASAYYPACAVAHPIPVRLKWCGQIDITELRQAVGRGWLAIADCRVRCANQLLPYRHRVGTVWPVGEWTVTLAGPEIESAYERGCLVSTGTAALYEPGMPVNRYLQTLWGVRQRSAQQASGTEARCVKLLMNSLIGKFAARQRCWLDAPDGLPIDPWSTWTRVEGEPPKPVRYRAIGWHTQKLIRGEFAVEATPALASWIYSVGRVQLNDWIETAGRENVYYVDSDSLFVSEDGRERLDTVCGLDSGRMGALRLQGVYPSLRIGGIRDYSAGGRNVQAGVPMAGFGNNAGVARWWRSETVRESVAEHRQPTATARLITMQLVRSYRHGTVDADGRVHPLTVHD